MFRPPLSDIYHIRNKFHATGKFFYDTKEMVRTYPYIFVITNNLGDHAWPYLLIPQKCSTVIFKKVMFLAILIVVTCTYVMIMTAHLHIETCCTD